jgi:hypothetical protein
MTNTKCNSDGHDYTQLTPNAKTELQIHGAVYCKRLHSCLGIGPESYAP